jgi:hypothetical protein
VDRPRYRKFDTPLTRPRALYVFVQFAAVLAFSSGLLYGQGRLSRPVLAAGAAFVLVSLVTLSALVEGRRWAPVMEAARIVVILVAAAGLPWR